MRFRVCYDRHVGSDQRQIVKLRDCKEHTVRWIVVGGAGESRAQQKRIAVKRKESNAGCGRGSRKPDG
jgi:hypothetical protein